MSRILLQRPATDDEYIDQLRRHDAFSCPTNRSEPDPGCRAALPHGFDLLSIYLSIDSCRIGAGPDAVNAKYRACHRDPNETPKIWTSSRQVWT